MISLIKDYRIKFFRSKILKDDQPQQSICGNGPKSLFVVTFCLEMMPFALFDGILGSRPWNNDFGLVFQIHDQNIHYVQKSALICQDYCLTEVEVLFSTSNNAIACKSCKSTSFLLEPRQYKNDSIQSKIIPILKLARFLSHCLGGEKERQFQSWNYF